ncbi:MAG TPA: IS1182 family transposase [Chitinophagaceae bacterium]|nr:IS1182 family transposase [Chitinophagaceae bacterium]
MKIIQGTSRQQMQFRSLDDFISADNPVRIIDAFVERLELPKIGIPQQRANKQPAKPGGAPRFDDKLLLKLYLYGYLNKIRSSRKLEQECRRNNELHWLMQELIPNYHTIADFRKDYPDALKNLFKLYVQFLDELNLLGKQTIGIDGSKFRAVNSSKNNYNQRKINKYRALIEEKADKYLKELDEIDKDDIDEGKLSYRKEEVEAALQRLVERKIKYDDLQQQLDNTEEKQISTSDSDSRSIIINRNIVEVSYNTQAAVDARHNLFVHAEATNTNDSKALHRAVSQAKENMNHKNEDSIDVLSDKGYHTGAELQQCHDDNIQTYVAFKEQSSVKHLQKEFLSTHFIYDKENDSYNCPAGETLTTLNTWHYKKGDAGETSYRFKTYRTNGCKSCTLKKYCTKLNRRIIHRSEYQDAVDRNNENIRQNPDYYKRRQSICEHPFGTIKRQWGYTYTLIKGLQKVNGEMNLIMLVYNIKRTLSILGFEKMMQAIENWKPDYKKVICAFKNTLMKMIYPQKCTIKFFISTSTHLFKTGLLSN